MKLTKKHKEAISVLKSCKEQGIFLCINLADCGGINYLAPILPNWKLVNDGITQWNADEKNEQYEISDVVHFKDQEYLYNTSYDYEHENNSVRITPTIVKDLISIGMIGCEGTFLIKESGKQFWFYQQWEERDFEQTYFFTAFSLI